MRKLDLRKTASNLFKIVSKIIANTLLVFFTKSHVIEALSGSHIAGNQTNKKEALPRAVMPPFLLCKDNIFLREMQIAVS